MDGWDWLARLDSETAPGGEGSDAGRAPGRWGGGRKEGLWCRRRFLLPLGGVRVQEEEEGMEIALWKWKPRALFLV